MRDHPRIRGEHDQTDHDTDLDPRIIPAYAGSTSSCHPYTCAPADHPRIRGEHGLLGHAHLSAQGSSPHTRGAQRQLCQLECVLRIIPAYAGSTGLTAASIAVPWDHPRIRGEHGPRQGAHAVAGGSSPHTRGAPIPLGAPAWAAGIIPAYAGSTFRPWIPAAGARDHPRIRGEHISCSRFVPAIMGSSPHTRGAPTGACDHRPGRRIIPAYAGSTRRT